MSTVARYGIVDDKTDLHFGIYDLTLFFLALKVWKTLKMFYLPCTSSLMLQEVNQYRLSISLVSHGSRGGGGRTLLPLHSERWDRGTITLNAFDSYLVLLNFPPWHDSLRPGYSVELSSGVDRCNNMPMEVECFV
jgi:hypothetical protein